MDIYQIWATHNKEWSKREIIVFSVILVLTAVIVIHGVYRKKIDIIQAAAIVVLIIFLGIVFASTVFTRTGSVRQYEILPLWSWISVIRGHNWPLIEEILLNCILLLPAGVLLPVIAGHRVKWYSALVFGILLAAIIEVCQLILMRGVFEWDDMLHNGLGCMLGCIFTNFLKNEK